MNEPSPCNLCSLRLALAGHPSFQKYKKYNALLLFVFLQRLEHASNVRHGQIAFHLN